MAITGCIKQNLIVIKPKKKLLCKEYLCGCTFCLQFDFENCSNENAADNGEDDADLEEFDESLIILNRFLFFCSLDLRMSHSLSSKLQEKALPKKTFLTHTGTLSRRYAVFPNKGSTQKQFSQEMLESRNFWRYQPGL